MLLSTKIQTTYADCLVGGDMMFMEGQSTGHIGLECINSTSYDAESSVCGPNNEIVTVETIMTCGQSSPYCMQCGPRGVGNALCLSEPDLGNRDCSNGVGGGGGNQDVIITDTDTGDIVILDDSSPTNDGSAEEEGGGDIVIIDFNEPNGSDNPPPANPTNPDEDEGFLPEEAIQQDPTTDGGEDATNTDTTADIEPFDLCDNAQDLSIWESNGGESTRPQHSKDCFEEYTGNGGKGCSMDEDCLSKCWMETYGYTKECVVCFVNVHQCSMDNGCMASW